MRLYFDSSPKPGLPHLLLLYILLEAAALEAVFSEGKKQEMKTGLPGTFLLEEL